MRRTDSNIPTPVRCKGATCRSFSQANIKMQRRNAAVVVHCKEAEGMVKLWLMWDSRVWPWRVKKVTTWACTPAVGTKINHKGSNRTTCFTSSTWDSGHCFHKFVAGSVESWLKLPAFSSLTTVDFETAALSRNLPPCQMQIITKVTRGCINDALEHHSRLKQHSLENISP